MLCCSQMILVAGICLPFNILLLFSKIPRPEFVEITMGLLVFSSTHLENIFLCIRHFKWPTQWSCSKNGGNHHTAILVSDEPEGRNRRGTLRQCGCMCVTGYFCAGRMCERARDILTWVIIFSFQIFCHFIKDYVRKSCLSKLINAQVSL